MNGDRTDRLTYELPPPRRLLRRFVSHRWLIPALALAMLGGGYLVLNDGRSEYRPVDLEAMGNFPFNDASSTTSNIPTQYRALDGTKVRVAGFTLDQIDTARGTEFQLVWKVDPNGWPQPIKEHVFVTAARGKLPPDFSYFGQVCGTLHVGVVRDAYGSLRSIYRLDLDKVIDLDAAASHDETASFLYLIGGAALCFWTMIFLVRLIPGTHARNWSGFCPVCGYDLRASPERCPECGTLNGQRIVPRKPPVAGQSIIPNL